MSVTTKALDTKDLENQVIEMYREVAIHPDREFHFETGRVLAERLGYPHAQLDSIPAASIDSFAGVGYYFDLAALWPGEAVVDLGSGSGMDSFLAARHVGSSGHVIGIDMTPAQLAKAHRLAALGSIANVEFRDAHIEELPMTDASMDVVISNGVINLSPKKPKVFAEAARVLRVGGRLAISDIVTAVHLPEEVVCDASLWAACIGGAMQREDYRSVIEDAGFEIETLRENDEYRFLSERADSATQKFGVKSVSILAYKVG
jgi:arsenite methyltransferase